MHMLLCVRLLLQWLPPPPLLLLAAAHALARSARGVIRGATPMRSRPVLISYWKLQSQDSPRHPAKPSDAADGRNSKVLTGPRKRHLGKKIAQSPEIKP